MARRALVTGSAKGIGRAILLKLAEEGLDVAVHYRKSKEEAERTRQKAEAFGVRSVLVSGDVASPEGAAGVVRAAARALGGLDVLVHNVGDYLLKPIDQVSPAEWRAILASNLDSAFYLTQAALPYLREGEEAKRVLYLGYAGAGQMLAKPEIAPYFVAKTGVLLLAKAYAKRFAEAGITFNVVAPGVAENSVTKPLREIPMGRTAKLEEIARAAWFFIDEKAGYITGQAIEVAGGWNL